MTNINDQAAKLLADLKAENKKASNFLNEINKKVVETDMDYVEAMIKDDENALKNVKDIVENE